MVPQDLAQYNKWFPKWREDFKSICLLSPWEAQYDVVRATFLEAEIVSLSKAEWDLRESHSESYDLICAMNVFQYAKDPATWFSNVFKSCKYFWIQDLVNRARGSEGHLCETDGDAMRYCYRPEVLSDFGQAFDLSALGDRVLDFVFYEAEPNLCCFNTVHFLARLRGDL